LFGCLFRWAFPTLRTPSSTLGARASRLPRNVGAGRTPGLQGEATEARLLPCSPAAAMLTAGAVPAGRKRNAICHLLHLACPQTPFFVPSPRSSPSGRGGCRKSQIPALIIVPATPDHMRNTVFLVGSAHPTKASIPVRSQACDKASPDVMPAQKQDPPGRNDDQGPKRRPRPKRLKDRNLVLVVLKCVLRVCLGSRYSLFEFYLNTSSLQALYRLGWAKEKEPSGLRAGENEWTKGRLECVRADSFQEGRGSLEPGGTGTKTRVGGWQGLGRAGMPASNRMRRCGKDGCGT